MAEYFVEVPIMGRAVVYVEAESQEEAIKKAENGETIEGYETEIEHFETIFSGCRGNVCNFMSFAGVTAELNE